MSAEEITSTREDVKVVRSWTISGWRAGLIRTVADDMMALVVTLVFGAFIGSAVTLLTLAMLAKGGKP
jgi:hypothetical protein